MGAHEKPDIPFATLFGMGIIVGVYLGTQGSLLVSPSIAQETGRGEPMVSPTEARERDFYEPNSEFLERNEIRVISYGTGMPAPRPAYPADGHGIVVQAFATTKILSRQC